MSIITFWNNDKGNIGQTSSIVATATLMAIEHNYRILVISTKIDDIESERAFGISESIATKVLGMKESRFNSGIQGLMKLAYSNKLTPEMVGDYTKIVLKRLEVISGARLEDMDENDKFDINLYPDIIKNASKYYDMVFVDVDGGMDEQYKKNILKSSNIIVWNFEQKYEKVEDVLQFKEKNDVADDKKILYLINKYEKNSRYNIKNIIRNSRMKKNIYTVPYDLLFSDVMQDGSLAGWLLNPKIRKAKPLDEHGTFINETNRLCQGIIAKLQELHLLG